MPPRSQPADGLEPSSHTLNTGSPPKPAVSSSWRERLPVHPAAELFPLMSEAELEQLAEDIKENDLLVRIVLLPDGQLIDGRNRLDAAERAGLPIFDEDGNLALPSRPLKRKIDPYVYVFSVNFRRRHLTPEQRDNVIRKAKAERPDLSIRAIAAAANTSKSTVDRALKGSGVPSGTPESVIGRDGKKYSAKARSPAKPKASPAQVHDKAIASFGLLLHQEPFKTLDDLGRILRGARGKIITLPLEKRRTLAREYLQAFGVRLVDLQLDEEEL
jgi:hypothetical protein